jgi:signal transduction histidine kinase/ActR/RegA family two-component response regulator
MERSGTAILDGITDAFLVLDPEWRCGFGNRKATEQFSAPGRSVVGCSLWELLPEELTGSVGERLRQAAREQSAVELELFTPETAAWLRLSVFPSAEGLALVFRDATRQKQLEMDRVVSLQDERDARVEAQALAAALRVKHEEVELTNEELQATNEELNVAIEELRQVNEALRVRELELQQLREESETIRRIGASVAAELDLQKLVQAVTDAATELTGAEFGAFFYNVIGADGEAYTLYTLSGVPREAFANFPMPRNTKVFAPTFHGTGVLRLDDVTQDPRYGKNPPYHGMPEGHLPVRSYLAVPVASRSGEVLGGLFFGHSGRGQFQPGHERMVVGIAAQAAVGIDNARLFEQARRAETQLRAQAESLRSQQEWLESVLNLLPVPLVFVEPGTARVTFANLAANEVAGGTFPTGKSADEYHTVYYCTDAAGNRIPNVEMPGVRVANGERLDGYQMDWHLPSGRHSIIVYGDTLPEVHGHPALSVLVFQDIGHLKRVEADLRRANETKDEFLAMLAHELRNPLAPMLTAIQILRRQGSDEDVLRRNREVIARQVQHMARLTDDLLDVSRITRRKIRIQPELLDFAALVRNCLDDHRPAIEASGLTLSAELPESPLYVHGDPTRLSQVASNLLSNAIKFSNPSGQIDVQVYPNAAGRQAVLRVGDTGVGISPDLQAHIWDAFTQEDRSLDRSRGGLGLGLALVRGLVELHGGTARAESDGVGRGAAFTIELPAVETALPQDEPANTAAGEQRPFRILVVDDNRDAADTLCDLLTIYDYQVEVAYSGPDALESARRFRPDIVLCDIGLPEMDGYAVARELRRQPATARIRLIAVTGYGQEEDIRRTREAGFSHHLTKPVDPDRLCGLLTQLSLDPS